MWAKRGHWMPASPSKQSIPGPQAVLSAAPWPFFLQVSLPLLPLFQQSSARWWEPLAPAECDRTVLSCPGS